MAAPDGFRRISIDLTEDQYNEFSKVFHGMRGQIMRELVAMFMELMNEVGTNAAIIAVLERKIQFTPTKSVHNMNRRADGDCDE